MYDLYSLYNSEFIWYSAIESGFTFRNSILWLEMRISLTFVYESEFSMVLSSFSKTVEIFSCENKSVENDKYMKRIYLNFAVLTLEIPDPI